MSKPKTLYVCNECGGQTPKWEGRCPACGEWNTLVEHQAAVSSESPHRFQGLTQATPLQLLSSVEAVEVARFSSGIAEFDRVLGGGFVPGGVVLIGGDPGIGKSTLLLQSLALQSANEADRQVLYVSGEESGAQIAMRARRLGLLDTRDPKSTKDPQKLRGIGPVQLLADISLERISTVMTQERPRVVVIDSIQTMYCAALSSAPGSVSQVRECAAQLTRLAKQVEVTLIIVGHVTKEGHLAGPRVLEHIVDTVLYFEGDTHSAYRLVRAFKNRFGAVNEIGVFAMTERGLRGVANPSALFLSHHPHIVSGSCVLVTQEGTRSLLVEIQALVDTAHIPNPRRLAVGLEQNRLAMLLAVLNRHAGIACFDQDVFLNAVGGVKITEPAADLAVLLAIHSSLRNVALPKGLVVFGEVGLAGEIRPCPRGQERLKEAAKLGFTSAIIPRANLPSRTASSGSGSAPYIIDGLSVYAVDRIEEAIERAQH